MSNNIEDRIAKIEDRVRRLEPQLIPDLGDILRSYPGGMPALARATGYHRETIYQFGSATRSLKFPAKRAAAIARAFGQRKAFGHRITIELLRRAWLLVRERPAADITRWSSSRDASDRQQRGNQDCQTNQPDARTSP